MISTAISAQGSTVSIGGVAGAPKTITGAAAGNPTIFTSVAHGFNNGDLVTIAAIVGTMSAANGTKAVVRSKTPNTYALDFDSTGLVWTSGGTATPGGWTNIVNIKSFTGFDGSASEIDTSNLQSSAKEFLMGLMDSGSFSMEMDADLTDPGQMALMAAQVSATKQQIKLVLPTGATATFSGFVKKASSGGGVDAALKRSVDIRISGLPVWS